MKTLLLSAAESTTRTMTHAQQEVIIYDNPDLVRVVEELSGVLTWGYIALGVALLAALGVIAFLVWHRYKK